MKNIFKKIWLYFFGLKDIEVFRVSVVVDEKDLCLYVPKYHSIVETKQDDGTTEYRMYGHIRSLSRDLKKAQYILYVRTYIKIK